MKLLLMTIVLNLLLSISGYAQSTNGKTLRVNPDGAIGGRVSQLIDSVLFVPLESSGESVFGLVDQLSVTDKYFIILDR